MPSEEMSADEANAMPELLLHSRGEKETKEGKEADVGESDAVSDLADLNENEESARDLFLKDQVYTYEGLFSTKDARIQNALADAAPYAYQENSRKEELCLEYVNNFVRQFESLFPDRKKLFVAPKNECGIRKFVCTTIRPTQLPFRALYNIAPAADFFAHFMQYEPLANPIAPPTHLPSPTLTLQHQVGDAFDLSTLLCSYLVGSGYDAYCVYGYAPRDVTLLNRTEEECPLLLGKGYVPADVEDVELEDLRPPEVRAATESKARDAEDAAGVPPAASGQQTAEQSADIIADADGSAESKQAGDDAEEANEATDAMGAVTTSGDGDNNGDASEGKAQDTEDAEAQGENNEDTGGEGDGEDAGAGDAPQSEEGGPAAAANGDDTGEDPYEIVASGLRKSKYLQRLEEDQRQAQEAKEAIEASNQYDEQAEEERAYLAAKAASPEPQDPIANERVHCWILVRAGKRQLDKTFFLEPTTGKLYDLRGSPYLGVEAVWNNKNYWVNMQNESDDPMNISYNLELTEHWEHIFVDSLSQVEDKAATPEDHDVQADLGSGGVLAQPAEDEEEEAEDETKEQKDEAILDLPPTWVEKLVLSRDAFRRRFNTTGQRTQLFLKSKLESYAPYLHPHGLVQRLVLFRDHARTMPIQVREYFANRRDKLTCRTRYPLQSRIVEEFAEGRGSGLRCIDEVIGKSRDVLFYKGSRLDGLVQRFEIMSEEIVERYEHRDDHLETRSMRLASLQDGEGNDGGRSAGGASASGQSAAEQKRGEAGSKHVMTLPRAHQGGDLSILQMKEVFSRDLDKDADEDICKRTFSLVEGSISIVFHYAKGRITRSSRVFHKDSGAPPEIELAGSFAKPLRQCEIDAEIQVNLQAEKDCYQTIRDMEREIQDILALRKREEANVVLNKSIFDTARERSKQQVVKDTETKEEEAKNPLHVDYLTPFLQDAKDLAKISRAEAEAARDACLKSLKERLLERANIIQCRLDEENAQLAKRQAAFQRSRDHVDGADIEFERFCSEAMFRIQILEQRLARHEESALSVYANLDQKLRSDPRLEILF
ncbi:Dynein regulatory complex subunit 7 [Hondaea fermentalgiana]|uniref:Dynein regulatory complex subunit 7 n=1 Tax=Hondaea fermentalgiana TaxID=2315210 RepID=A0A2R5H1C5_9STRA|nr:Dynein regulatory complex subunit 7 [Hondaea fermentalgiana]|eukprot:GBG34883.1 Dynein regulatory complex subunit 7 [Hondaea fermentalgiana]